MEFFECTKSSAPKIPVHTLDGMYLIPKNLQIKSDHGRNFMWHDVVDDAPDTLQTSLAACEQKLFQHFSLLVPIDGSTMYSRKFIHD